MGWSLIISETLVSTTRVFTGLKPTGRLQLGNYLGALRPMVDLARDPAHDVTVCVVDLHALTVDHDPAALAACTLDLAATVMACGLDDRAALFVQSALPAHTELSTCWRARRPTARCSG